VLNVPAAPGSPPGTISLNFAKRSSNPHYAWLGFPIKESSWRVGWSITRAGLEPRGLLMNHKKLFRTTGTTFGLKHATSDDHGGMMDRRRNMFVVTATTTAIGPGGSTGSNRALYYGPGPPLHRQEQRR
jgi:hypothetical protein